LSASSDTLHAVTLSPPAATQWALLLLRAAYGLQRTPRLTMHCQWGWLSIFFRFLWPRWPLI